MNTASLLRTGGLLVLAGVAACGDTAPVVSPLRPSAPSLSAAPTEGDDRNIKVSPALAQMNARLAAMGSNLRVAKAELLLNGKQWNAAASTIIIASDRQRGIGSEWVKGDPRRDGRVGVTYAIASDRALQPLTRNPDGSNLRRVPYAQLQTQLEEGTNAWRNLTCSTAPLTRVGFADGTDPDFVDNFFLGKRLRAYVQPADIVQGGWLAPEFFRNMAVFFGGKPEDGDNVIGVTFTFTFVDNANRDTDIDNNGKDDIGLAEVFYNTAFAWGTTGALNVVDFYSIITHETGHAVGLGHFGKVFVTESSLRDGFQLADIQYSPLAIMNAVYVTGRGEIAGEDNSAFCQIWGND